MLPGDIRAMALEAAGFNDDADASKAGVAATALVGRIEKALLKMRKLTSREAAEIVRAHGNATAKLVEQLIPEGD